MDHDDLEEFLDRLVEALRRRDRAFTYAAFRGLEARLAAHLAMEEELLFPAFARVDPQETDELRAEHRWLREAIAAMAFDLHQTRLSAIEDFAQKLRRHTDRENALLYRWADRTFSEPAHRVAFEWFFPPDRPARAA